MKFAKKKVTPQDVSNFVTIVVVNLDDPKVSDQDLVKLRSQLVKAEIFNEEHKAENRELYTREYAGFRMFVIFQIDAILKEREKKRTKQRSRRRSRKRISRKRTLR